jgi:hypothetical protein
MKPKREFLRKIYIAQKLEGKFQWNLGSQIKINFHFKMIFLSSFERERNDGKSQKRKWNLEESEMIEFQFGSRGENSFCDFDVVVVL